MNDAMTAAVVAALISGAFALFAALIPVLFTDKSKRNLTAGNKRLARNIGIGSAIILVLCLGFIVWKPGFPSIEIIKVPLFGVAEGQSAMEKIAGNVNGVNPIEYRVVVYAYTDQWYVQPNEVINQELGGIGSDGAWELETHHGNRYVALLVKPSYVPIASLGARPTPDENVVAISKEAH
jgi:hypothetical protein